MSLFSIPRLAASRLTRPRLGSKAARGGGRRPRVALPSRLMRAVSVALVINILAVQTPAAPRVIAGAAAGWHAGAVFLLDASGLGARLDALLSAAQRPSRGVQAKQSQRDAAVARVRISPGDVTVTEGEVVVFAASALDAQDAPVGGVRFKWRAFDLERNRPLKMRDGKFTAHTAGTFRVVAECSRQQSSVTVQVLADAGRRGLPASPPAERRVSSRDVPQEQAASRPAKTTARRRAAAGGAFRPVKFVKASYSAPEPAPAAVPLIDPDAGWGEINGNRADDPANRVGNPPGTPADGGAGSGNYHLDAPVLGLPGRGLNVSLGLSYNSLLWSKTGTSEVTFDADRSWPAPGWTLGFGKIIGMNLNGSLLVEPDGTRRSFSGTVHPSGSLVTFNGKTADGSFIDYTTNSFQGAVNSARAVYPNGTVINYGAPANGAVYPIRLTDVNGNYVTVTYRSNRGPEIDTVIDTLGRVITFHYDSAGLLTAITAPEFNAGTRTLVRLQYRQTALGAESNYGFDAGIVARVRDAAPQQLKAIYYPGTGTGYWFGDPDSYSPYGMISKVAEQHSMTFNGAAPAPPGQGPTEQGNIAPGTASKALAYNYPAALGALTDAPTYTSATLSWAHADTPDAVTNYFAQKTAVNPSQPDVPSSKSEVTLPNNTKTVQYSYRMPGDFKDGLIYQDDMYDSAGALLSSSKVSWQKGDYDAPRPWRTEVTDERGQTLKTEYDYASYNQTAEVRQFDYDGTTLLKRTVTSYLPSPNHTARHVFGLPESVDVYGPDGVRASRVVYEYDGAPLAAATSVSYHDPSHDPHNTEWFDNGQCCEPGEGPHGEMYCVQFCQEPVFKSETNFRGLVMKVTTFKDAAPETAAGPVSEKRTYDITGNLVTVTADCCEQSSTVYTVDTQYAYPESHTRGSSDPQSPHRVTTYATHDFNTGLDLTATDANGRTTQSTYYPASLRPHQHIMPTGARTTFEYDDALMSVTETAALTQGGPAAAKSVTYLNGLGLTRRAEALGAAGAWDVVETKYDVMGRVWKQSRPYRSGSEQPQWDENFYDAQGRVWKTLAPDGSQTLSHHNEATRPDAALPGAPAGQTVRSVNAWGQERWGRHDAQGRLVEVVEPNPSGDGTVAVGGLLTTYAYDAAGNLTQVNQGAQQRRFRYDSLGRLTHQKLAETLATLDDAGQYVGAGGLWSDAFAYDSRSNLIARTDARGVTVNFAYNDDPLNRLQAVSYTVGAQHDATSPIRAAATVTYQYAPSGDRTRVGSVVVNGVSTEVYGYDTEGRLNYKKLTLTDRPGSPLETDFTYDALDRLTDVKYPAQHVPGSLNPPARKTVHHDFDAASRLSGLKVNGTSYASEVGYDASSRATTLKVGAGSNFSREHYVYDAATGLLQSQSVMRQDTNAILSLSYDYLRAGTTGGRTGQVTKVTDNLKQQRGRTYSYDALGRLKQAAGGSPASAPLWTQVYGYDRYGNRESVAAGNTAALSAPPEPSAKMPRVEVASNHAAPPELLRENQPRTTTDAPDGPRLYAAAPKPASAPLVDNPSNLQVTSAGDSQIILSWSSASGGSFRVERSPSLSGGYTLLGTSAANGFTDSAVSRGNAYLYRVCAAGAGGQCVSGYSKAALGTAVSFADPQLGSQVTTVKAQHFADLRLAVNAVRRAADLGDATWAEPSLTPQSTSARAQHVQELRDRLNEALAALDIAVAPFTDPVLGAGAGGGAIRKVHVEELRARASRGQSDTDNGGGPVPTDGLASLSYDAASNRVNSPGWQYDAAGNQTRVQTASGGWQRMEYDAANRLAAVKTDAGALIASYTYGDSNARLVTHEAGSRTYYAWGTGGVIAEYTEVDGTPTAAAPQWSKSYVYFGERLLATEQPGLAGGEFVEYHHPDRLGTRVVTNNTNASFYEQAALPYGTALAAESTGATSRRFTTYERSASTGLDYAVNRHYDPLQGRFTQIDPLEMRSTNTADPQSFNLYAYCGNDPVNRLDPDGLFWGKLWRFIKKALRIIAVAVAVALAVVAIVAGGPGFLGVLKIISAVANAAKAVFDAFGLTKIGAIFGIISAAAGSISSIASIKNLHDAKGIFKAIADGASLTGRVLTQFGQRKLSQVFSLVSSVASFISSGIKAAESDDTGKVIRYEFKPDKWEIFAFARGLIQQIAGMTGARKLADFMDVLGLVTDVRDFYQAVKDWEKDREPYDDFIATVVEDFEKYKNKRALFERDKRNAYLKFVNNRLERIGKLVGRVNSGIGRVEKGIAFAR